MIYYYFQSQDKNCIKNLQFLHMSLTKYSSEYWGKIFKYENIFGINIKLEYEYEYIWTLENN